MSDRVSAAELARRLGYSRQRISQLVQEGALEGAYTGEGRARRFDVAAVVAALSLRLDVTQVSGNGALHALRRALLAAGGAPEGLGAGAIDIGETADAQAALIAAKAERARLEVAELRRREAAQQGRWVLASEVAREVRRALAAEVLRFREVFDMALPGLTEEHGVPTERARAVLDQCWREHVARRRELFDTQR